MDKQDAAKVVYGYVPGGDTFPLDMMDHAQREWGKLGVKETW